MASLSVSSHTRLVHWQVLLVAVSLFNFWCHSTTAPLHVVSTSTAQGEAALLSLCNTPPDVSSFTWYRGQSLEKNRMIAFSMPYIKFTKTGNAYTGRETINSDGSLLIANATMNDAVTYSVEVYITDEGKTTAIGWLDVYEPELVVSLSASSTIVIENKDSVVFTCNTNALSIHWLVNGMNLQLNERMKVSNIRQTLTIDPVKKEDSGIYKCEVYNPITSTASSSVMLNVLDDIE